jgi:signal transduction histidine kinase
MKRFWLDRVPLRLRIFFRGAFLALALAVVGLAVSVLEEEKRLSYAGYRDVFQKTVEQIAARLRHPTGQLALLNPVTGDDSVTPLRPLVLPFSAIDFDDRAKAREAVEMTGCSVQYPDRAQLCVAVGNAASPGAFLYIVGEFDSGPLSEHAIGNPDLASAHRVAVEVTTRGATARWIAVLETASIRQSGGVHGRLTGHALSADGRPAPRPDHEFRGWLWQDGRCIVAAADEAACAKRSYFSLRVPVESWRVDLATNPRSEWPPADLGQARVHVAVLAPGGAPPVFDSNASGATPPFSLAELRSQIHEGERLVVKRVAGDGRRVVVADVTGRSDPQPRPLQMLTRLIRKLPVEGYDQPLESSEMISTPLGEYAVTLTGDVRGLDRSLSLVASRLSWYVGALLVAIGLTWLAIEMRIVRRITLLTKRAAAVRKSVESSQGLIQLDLDGLRGSDELGLLSGVLSDLMVRVNDDVKREQIRAVQEKDMWHAVGHEIKSPLQSLLALHPDPADPGRRYIERMQQAVRVLYGSASPSEAILSASLSVGTLDLRAFLEHVAANAADAGIPNIEFADNGGPVMVRAHEHSLEDVVGHVLANADRYRPAGSPIRISLDRHATEVRIVIHNQGPPIDPALAGKIFEYGVSDGEATGSRGQGLFVARTYMAKMGGTVEARNESDGVAFVLSLPLAG